MSFPRYDSYKDSGVEWLGEVPEHWGNSCLRWISKRYSGGTPDKTNQAYWDEGTIPWINSGSVNNPIIDEPSAYITDEAFANSSAKWIPKYSLVMALAGQGKTKGMVSQLGINTTCNQSMAAIIPTNEIDARFLYWWLVSNYQNIRNMAGGDLRDGLNLELLGNIPCPLFPQKEQLLIAKFLDQETAKIDNLIVEQERLIALLKEKRQAVISHAVTKGLNPDVPMKDSGVEWLGEVPEHWSTVKLFFLTHKIGDGLHGTPQYVEVSDFLFINGNNLSSGAILITESTRCISKEEYEKHRVILGDNSLLMSINGTIGSVAFYQGETVMLGKSAAYINCSNKLSRNFLYYFLQSTSVKTYFELEVTGTTIFNLSLESIRNLSVALPSLVEQSETAVYLDNRISEFDSLLVETQRAITLLQERRTALISSAVTGKIDVRNFVPSQPNVEAMA